MLQSREKVEVTRQLLKTMQRFEVSHVKSICSGSGFEADAASFETLLGGTAYIHGAHGLVGAHVAMVVVTVVHLYNKGLRLRIFNYVAQTENGWLTLVDDGLEMVVCSSPPPADKRGANRGEARALMCSD